MTAPLLEDSGSKHVRRTQQYQMTQIGVRFCRPASRMCRTNGLSPVVTIIVNHLRSEGGLTHLGRFADASLAVLPNRAMDVSLGVAMHIQTRFLRLRRPVPQ